MIELLILFLEFGLILNVFSLVIHLLITLISTYNIGVERTFKISLIAKESLENYNTVKKAVEPVRHFLENISLFIPFYATWTFFKILTQYRSDVPYYALPIVLKMEELTRLAKKYNL